MIREKKNGTVQGQYTYDSANNVQKAGLTYTNGKLTAVNGAQIVYDALGNPTKYKGNTFTWQQGRKLVSGSMNGKSFTYRYDGNGMRYEKTVSGTKTHYYYNGTQLLMESKGKQRTYYIYGVTGIEGMITGTGSIQDVYYFDKNTLGDVIAIRNANGNVVATYEYDAWGKTIVKDSSGTQNTSATFIGNVNPIRYRGYYYDTETGFYYLQTRYYDPTICRFINADSYELVAQLSSSKELNMYAYCANNPIMFTDETGAIAKWAIALIATGVIIAVNHIISLVECAIADTKVKDRYTQDEAIKAIQDILGDEYTGKVILDYKSKILHIEDSYKIHSRYKRILISKIYQNTEENGNKYTQRTTYGLSAEWAGHKIVSWILPGENRRTDDVDLDSIFGNNYEYTKYGTVLLAILGVL